MTKIPQPVVSTPINSSLTNARLEWSNSWNVSANPPTYMVQYSAAHAAVDPIVIRVQDELHVDLENLAPSTEYQYVVYSVFDNGVNSEAAVGTFTTLTPGESYIRMFNHTPHSIAVSWNTTGAVGLDIYLLQCFENKAHIKVMEQLYSAEITNIVLKGLIPGVAYRCDLTPYYNVDKGSIVPAVDHTTLPTPKEVEVFDITASAAKVRWNMLDGGESGDSTDVVDHYALQWSSNRGDGRSEVKEKKYQLHHLRPNTTYEVTISAVTSDDQVSAEASTKFTTSVRLTSPEVHFTEATNTSVKLAWSSINVPVSKWSVLFWPRRQKHLGRYVELAPDLRESVFTDLEPAQWYRAEVRGILIGDERHYNGPAGKTMQLTKPTSPQGVDIINSGYNQLVFKLAPTTTRNVKYQAFCTSMNGTTVKAKFSSKFTAVCSKLNPAAHYKVEAVAVHKSVRSDPAFTLGQTRTPPVTDLQLSDPTPSSFVVTWTAPKGIEVDHYNLSYHSNYDNGEVTLSGDDTTYVLENLTPDTDYEVELELVTVNGGKSVHVATMATTAREELDFRAINANDFAITVAWNPTKFKGQSPFRIEYCPVPSSSRNCTKEETASRIVPSNADSYTITDLIPDTLYHMRLVPIFYEDEISENVEEKTLEPRLPQMLVEEDTEEEQPTCGCQEYTQSQQQMQDTIDSLIRQINVLNSKVNSFVANAGWNGDSERTSSRTLNRYDESLQSSDGKQNEPGEETRVFVGERVKKHIMSSKSSRRTTN